MKVRSEDMLVKVKEDDRVNVRGEENKAGTPIRFW